MFVQLFRALILYQILKPELNEFANTKHHCLKAINFDGFDREWLKLKKQFPYWTKCNELGVQHPIRDDGNPDRSVKMPCFEVSWLGFFLGKDFASLLDFEVCRNEMLWTLKLVIYLFIFQNLHTAAQLIPLVSSQITYIG